MDKVELLIDRLDRIGESLENSRFALALLALGSCGRERERMDKYSDLDFFVIVREGYKQNYLPNLDWLTSIKPVAFKFRNTDNGYKVLFDDGVYCEFAVFEQEELKNTPFSEGKIIWKSSDFDEEICKPANLKLQDKNVEWLIGEALTNLYVGLGRYRRGEKAAAFNLVQKYAVDRILEISSFLETEKDSARDKFACDRRFESRFPHISKKLPEFLQGYDKTVESAKAMIDFLDSNFSINNAMKSEILKLI